MFAIEDIKMPFLVQFQCPDYIGKPGNLESDLDYKLDLVVSKVVDSKSGPIATVYIYSKEDSDSLMTWFWKTSPATYVKTASQDFFEMKELDKLVKLEDTTLNCNPTAVVRKSGK